MKKFCKNLFYFSLIFLFPIVLVVCFDFLIIGNQYAEEHQAAILDKVARLNAIESPKIILVGNSNVFLGVDSVLLEEELGMPVVNMGMSGNLGNSFLEDLSKSNINPGDLIVVCHSDFGDDGTIPQPLFAWSTVEKHVSLWPLLFPHAEQMLRSYPEYVFHSFERWQQRKTDALPVSNYLRNQYNAQGDLTVRPEHLQGTEEELFPPGTVQVPEISETCIQRLNQFHIETTQKGAALLVVGYPIGDAKDRPSTEAFVAFGEELRQRLDCPVISDYTDYIYPMSYFFDSRLHPNFEGTEVRTRQLIEDLQAWQASFPAD